MILTHEGEAFIWRFDTMQLQTVGVRIWPKGWTLPNIYEGEKDGEESDWLGETERDRKGGGEGTRGGRKEDLHYQWQIKAESLPSLLSFIAIHI